VTLSRAGERALVAAGSVERSKGAGDDGEQREPSRGWNTELCADLDEAVMGGVPSHADPELLAIGKGRQPALGVWKLSGPTPRIGDCSM